MLADESFYQVQFFMLITGDESNSVAGGFSAAGAADAMNVIFRYRGDVEIYDVRDAGYVDAAGCDIGGDHDAEFAIFETVEGTLALALGAVGVYCYRFDVCALEIPVDFIGAVFCARENQDAGHLVILEEFEEQADFILAFDHIDILIDSLDGISGNSDLNHYGVFLDSFGETADFRGDGSGKEHGLSVSGDCGNNSSNIADETHIEHSVCLIENEDFDVPKVDGAAVHVVEEAAGCSDNDIDALTQGIELGFDIYAAIDGECSEMEESSITSN